MTFVIYGTQRKAIGIFEPSSYECPNCETQNTTYIVVYSMYYHVFWIPFFPYEKDSVANCSECGFTRNEIKFGPALIKEFDGQKKKYKHRWWTYSLAILVISITIAAIFSSS